MSFTSKIEEEYPLNEINVTPFVDVLLVLLVIFMITAPIVTQSIRIKLPQENLKTSQGIDQKKLIVTINKKGTLFINDKKMTLNQLLAFAKEWKSNANSSDHLFIRADKSVPYGKITSIMARLKNIGILNIGLLVEKSNRT